MRHLFLSAVLLFAALYCAGAQDIILLRDGNELKTVVKEISEEEVKYTSWPEGSGPLLTVSTGDIFKITFQNGETQMFGTAVPDGKYEIGDIYDRDGVKGIVVHTTDDGRHGLIMSLISPYGPHDSYKMQNKNDKKMWCSRALVGQTIGMTDEDDGMNNMRILEQAIEANGLSWDDFPAFKLCVEMGDGWYLPAINEVEYIVKAMNGGTLLYNALKHEDFNAVLIGVGGDPIGFSDKEVYEFQYKDCGDWHSEIYHAYKMAIPSSTEYKAGLVKSIVGDLASDFWPDYCFKNTWSGKNNNKWFVRITAVHKF